MKIAANTFVKLRDGSKARVYAVDGAGPCCIHGSLLHEGEWFFSVWHKDGSFDRQIQHPHDIISEWPVVWEGEGIAYRDRILVETGTVPSPFHDRRVKIRLETI